MTVLCSYNKSPDTDKPIIYTVAETTIIIQALLLEYSSSAHYNDFRLRAHHTSDPKRCTPVKGRLICFTWLQKGLLKPLLKNSLRVHPRANIYWHNNSIIQHCAATVEPVRAQAFNPRPHKWHRWTGLETRWHSKRSVLNCCKVTKLTAAMVAASHSSFTNTVEKELAQTEHQMFSLFMSECVK